MPQVETGSKCTFGWARARPFLPLNFLMCALCSPRPNLISSDSVRYYSCVLGRRRKQPRPHCRNSNPGGLFDGDGDEHQRWHRRRRSCSGGGGSSSPRIWTSAWFDGGGRIAGTSRDRESTQPTTQAICWIGSIPSLPRFFLMLIAFIFTITMTHPVTVCMHARVIEQGHLESSA